VLVSDKTAVAGVAVGVHIVQNKVAADVNTLDRFDVPALAKEGAHTYEFDYVLDLADHAHAHILDLADHAPVRVASMNVVHYHLKVLPRLLDTVEVEN
jgi:hypothetical protein